MILHLLGLRSSYYTGLKTAPQREVMSSLTSPGKMNTLLSVHKALGQPILFICVCIYMDIRYIYMCVYKYITYIIYICYICMYIYIY